MNQRVSGPSTHDRAGPARGRPSIQIDSEAQTVRVPAGIPWREVHAATGAHGLYVPSGIDGTTAVGDLSPAGSLGYLSRSHGRTVDNLLRIELGGDGEVARLAFRLHRLGDVVGGFTFWPLAQADAVLRWYLGFIGSAPRALNGFFALMRLPALAGLEPALHGRTVCAVVWCHVGTQLDAERDFVAVRRMNSPVLLALRRMPFGCLQDSFDAMHPPNLGWTRRARPLLRCEQSTLHLTQAGHPPLPCAHSSLQIHAATGPGTEPWLLLSAAGRNAVEQTRISAWCRRWARPGGCAVP